MLMLYYLCIGTCKWPTIDEAGFPLGKRPRMITQDRLDLKKIVKPHQIKQIPMSLCDPELISEQWRALQFVQPRWWASPTALFAWEIYNNP